MANRTFADRLRAEIEGSETLTPAGLATKAGLDNSTIRQILSGKAQNPRIDTAMKICSALGTTLEEFMGLERDPIQGEILSLYTQLSDSERQLLLAAAKGFLSSQDRPT